MGNNIQKIRTDEISKHYELKETLGRGTFAIVKRGIRRQDGKEFAIRMIKKTKLSTHELGNVHEEVEILHMIQHPHCAQVFEMFESPVRIIMVMELLSGGELFDRISSNAELCVDKDTDKDAGTTSNHRQDRGNVNDGEEEKSSSIDSDAGNSGNVTGSNFSEKSASALFKDIVTAVDYIHSLGIIHRDLKPENLMFSSKKADAQIKLTDFGLAKFAPGAGHQACHTPCGTPGYTAPEILTNKPYGKAVDMWSLGVILYSILCAFPPFYHDNTAKLYRMIRKGEYSFPDPYWTEISESAKDLIRGLLTVNAKKRMTAAEVLRHPWIVGNNLSTRSLGDNYADRVSIMHARNKFRRVIRKVLAINRFARVLKMIQQLEDASDGPSTNFVDLTALRGIQAADADDSDRDEEDGEEASAGKLANRRLSNQFRNYNRYTYAKNTSAKKKSPTTSHRNMSYSASSSPSPSSSSSSSSSLSSSSSSQRSSVPSMRRRGSRSSLNVASPSASSSSSSSPQSIGKKSKRTRKSLDANLKQIQE